MNWRETDKELENDGHRTGERRVKNWTYSMLSIPRNIGMRKGSE